MTIYEKNISLLKAFGIPADDGDKAEKIRGILARCGSQICRRHGTLLNCRKSIDLKYISFWRRCLFP